MNVSVRLWIPEYVNPSEVSPTLNMALDTGRVHPPFETTLQNVVDHCFTTPTSQSRSKIQRKYAVTFPRGPVQFVPEMSSVSNTRGIRNVIADQFARGLMEMMRRPPQQPPVTNPLYVQRTGGRAAVAQRGGTTSIPTQPFTCAVCLDSCTRQQRQRVLPCAHKFHAACVDRWLSNHDTCPTCRSQV